MSALFGVVGRSFWLVTGIIGALTLVATWLEYYQAMAILACTFGGLLMWDAERHDPPRRALEDLDAPGVAEPAV